MDATEDKTTLRPQKLYQQMVAHIEGRIISGDLQPGDRLPNERDMAGQFGVSRTVVREAMKAMVRMGLVEVRHGSGSYVSHGTTDAFRDSMGLMLRMETGSDWRQLSEVRAILEPEIAALAAAHATAEHVLSLERAFERMDAARSQADPEGYVRADGLFHLTLAQAASNALLVRLLEPVMGLLQEQRRAIFAVSGGPSRGQTHHRRILNAVRDRDPERAREAMRGHMRQVRTDSDASERKPKQ